MNSVVKATLQQCPEYLIETCDKLSQVIEHAARSNEALDMTKYSSHAIREHLLGLAGTSSIRRGPGQEMGPGPDDGVAMLGS